MSWARGKFDWFGGWAAIALNRKILCCLSLVNLEGEAESAVDEVAGFCIFFEKAAAACSGGLDRIIKGKASF